MSVETTRVEDPTPGPLQEQAPTQSALSEPPGLDSPAARERLLQGEAIIRDNTLWALGAGAMVIVWPLMDVVAATAVQLKMLKNLSDLYGVQFSKGLAVKVVGAVLMGSGGAYVGDEVMVRLFKLIPGVGTALGAVSTPLMAAAFAHALGRIYLVHLDSGGALLDFDASAIRERFKDEFEKSKQAVVGMVKQKGMSTPASPRE